MENFNGVVHEAINEEYEWIQYNNKLRVIRCIKDDMYQMKSIVAACNSAKKPNDWLENQSTREILSEFGSARIPAHAKSHEKRENLPNNLKGWYVHRLLVNAVAMWASPRYAIYIFKLLDDIASTERKQMENKLEEKQEEIEKRIPRCVPQRKEKNYKYMIYKKETGDDEIIELKLVRCNNHSFIKYKPIRNDPEKCWFYRENLPIAMTPNEDIKQIIRDSLPAKEYDIKGSSVMIWKEHLPMLLPKIEKYFEDFRINA